MRNLIAALAVGAAAVGFAASAQAAPSSSLAPLSTLTQSSGVETVQYHHRRCHKVRVCHGHGYHRKCHYETRCHRHH